MTQPLSCTAFLLTVLAAAAPLQAQDPPAAPPVPQERVFVKLTDTTNEMTGRLLRLDAETLSIEVDGRSVDLPLARVARVQVKKRDSLVNGAVYCAIYAAVCAATWCNQGADEPANLPLDAFLVAGVGAALGAGVDALIVGRKTIFEAPRQEPGRTAALRPALAVSFTF